MTQVKTILLVLSFVVAVPAAAQVMSPADYAKTAGAIDFYPRQSSQIVVQSTWDAKISSFAQRIIADHARGTADVNAPAGGSRVTALPPKLMPARMEMIARHRAESGPSRDAAYPAPRKAEGHAA